MLLALDLGNPALSVARVLLIVSAGLAMVAAGLVASANGEERLGVLVVVAGAAWLAERLLQAIANPLAATLGQLLTMLWLALLVQAIVSFPSGRLASRLEGGVVAAGYVSVGLNVPVLLVAPALAPGGRSNHNVLALFPSAGTLAWMLRSADAFAVAWIALLVGLIVAKAWAAVPAARGVNGPVWAPGALLFLDAAVIAAGGLGTVPHLAIYRLWLEVLAGLVAVALGATLFTARRAGDRLVGLVADLATIGPGAALRDALRRALADPGLELVYVQAGTGGWINEVGQSMTAPVAVAGRAVTPIVRDGKPVAALVHNPVLLRNPERLQAGVRAADLAIASEQHKAELRAQVLDAQASRARIVNAGDHERRRVERNLHDGAQQRLVGLALTLRLASRKATGDPVVTELLAEAAGELDDALKDLRDLAGGIHPAIVTDAGLPGALEVLAERPGVPVDLSVEIDGRLPDPVEVGAYYLVAEALANANKHAQARQVTVRAAVVNDALIVAVSDDGSGGAAAAPGSGLEGLADRVSALGGQLVIESPVGQGTTVRADIPLHARTASDISGKRLAALRWIGWENWEAPGELYEQITEEDNILAAKATLLCAGGNGQLMPREREWLIGYHTAAGSSDRVIEFIKAYDDTDTIESLMRLPGMSTICRANIYEALRVCASDGPLTPAELDRVRQGAHAMGIPHETLAALHQIVTEEGRLRDRRYELIAAPVLPGYIRKGTS